MPSARTCSHIKTNGVKCGSPALRHNTLCYFHYQWDRRERRRVRLGGPVGMNKNTGIELPILEGPESIILAIMEVQRALLDARIDRQMAHTLLYSLQLAIQLKVHSYSGLSDKIYSVPTCPELDQELELDRARGLRPATTECSSCRQKDSCTSPKTCRKMPSSRPERSGVDGPAVRSSAPPIFGSSVASPCHPERSAAVSRGVEGPFVSSPEATNLDLPRSVGATSNQLRDGVTVDNIHASRAPRDGRSSLDAPDRKQKVLRLRATNRRSAQDDTFEGLAIAVETRNLKLETASPLESSSARECGVTVDKIHASRAPRDGRTSLDAPDRKQKVLRLRATNRRSAQDDTFEGGAVAVETRNLKLETASPLESSPARECGLRSTIFTRVARRATADRVSTLPIGNKRSFDSAPQVGAALSMTLMRVWPLPLELEI